MPEDSRIYTGNDIARICDVLVGAFDRFQLARLVRFRLDLEWDSIADPGLPYRSQVLNLVEWMYVRRRLNQLIVAAAYANPDNPELVELRARYAPGTIAVADIPNPPQSTLSRCKGILTAIFDAIYDAFDKSAGTGNNYPMSTLPGAATQLSTTQRLRLDFSHVKRISKGHSSPFIVTLYLPASEDDVKKNIDETFGTRAHTQNKLDTELVPGMDVTVELWSLALEFSPSRKVTLTEQPTRIDFVGIPADRCIPGEQTIDVFIRDVETNRPYFSHYFFATVVDYAFDHVSRPKLQIGMSAVTGIAAAAVWTLTFFGQIDTTLGMTAGTAATAFSGLLAMQAQQFYRIASSTVKFPNQP